MVFLIVYYRPSFSRVPSSLVTNAKAGTIFPFGTLSEKRVAIVDLGYLVIPLF